MGKGHRQGRLGEEIRKIVSELLLRGELKDPALSGWVSISAVDVTSDGSLATVYISVMKDTARENLTEEQDEVLAAFRRAKGLIRKEVGRQVKLRHVPDLLFKADQSMEYGRHISRIIDELGMNKKNNTLSEIAGQLLNANDILIFPHVLMDGDALGSGVALCKALRSLGKNAFVLIEDDIPQYLHFLAGDYCTWDNDVIREPDLCVCIDCAEVERFALRKDKFAQGKVTMCIDHHKTTKPFAAYNYIDASAAATGEIIYQLLIEMDVEIDKEMGEALYAAVTTDTGNFQYSNTVAETHLLAAKLFDLGIDHWYVSRMLYQSTRVEKIRLSGKILQTLRLLEGGLVALAYISEDMLKEADALLEDAEGSSEVLRGIIGVEVGIFAKEAEPNVTKFSMRSKEWVDVSVIAMKHGGGGHTRAAGCTIKAPLHEAIKMVEADVQAYFASNDRDSE